MTKQDAYNQLEKAHKDGLLTWVESQRRMAMVARATNKARLTAIVTRGV